jgi:hypothetical protein
MGNEIERGYIRKHWVQRPRLALSNGPSWVDAAHLPAWGRKYFCFPKRCVHYNVRRWTKHRNLAIPSLLHIIGSITFRNEGGAVLASVQYKGLRSELTKPKFVMHRFRMPQICYYYYRYFIFLRRTHYLVDSLHVKFVGYKFRIYLCHFLTPGSQIVFHI